MQPRDKYASCRIGDVLLCRGILRRYHHQLSSSLSPHRTRARKWGLGICRIRQSYEFKNSIAVLAFSQLTATRLALLAQDIQTTQRRKICGDEDFSHVLTCLRAWLASFSKHTVPRVPTHAKVEWHIKLMGYGRIERQCLLPCGASLQSSHQLTCNSLPVFTIATIIVKVDGLVAAPRSSGQIYS